MQFFERLFCWLVSMMERVEVLVAVTAVTWVGAIVMGSDLDSAEECVWYVALTAIASVGIVALIDRVGRGPRA